MRTQMEPGMRGTRLLPLQAAPSGQSWHATASLGSSTACSQRQPHQRRRHSARFTAINEGLEGNTPYCDGKQAMQALDGALKLHPAGQGARRSLALRVAPASAAQSVPPLLPATATCTCTSESNTRPPPAFSTVGHRTASRSSAGSQMPPVLKPWNNSEMTLLSSLRIVIATDTERSPARCRTTCSNLQW